MRVYTVCPRSSYPIFIVSYYIKWVNNNEYFLDTRYMNWTRLNEHSINRKNLCKYPSLARMIIYLVFKVVC